MKILIINHYGQSAVRETKCIPAIGTQVDLFYKPAPEVQRVVHLPSKELLASCGMTEEMDAVILVS